MNIFNLPDLGEGLPDAEIVQWYVKVGEKVNIDTPLVSMETAKAVVDVPSPVSGTIKALFGKAGEIIPTGAPLVEFDVEVPQKPKDPGTVAGALQTSDQIVTQEATTLSTHTTTTNAKATPMVRALAQRLQVDLTQVTPTGPDNTITSKDVENAANNTVASDSIALRGVRRAMALSMEKSHQEVVPVTISDDAILHKYQQQSDITVQVIQALAAAIKAEPALNAWYDAKNYARRFIAELDLGIAIDTEEGLFVPVLRNANNKDANALRAEINQLRQQVEQRSIKPESLRGSSFVLSNFGKFAGRYASPIISPPCVAILAVGKLRDAAIPINGVIAINKLLPLSLTFDHRACTGGEAARFLGEIIKHLETNA